MKKQKNETVVHFILDKSGSMESIKKATIDGFNEYLEGLQKNKNSKNIRFSLTLFDTVSIETPYENTPVEKVKKLNSETYQPTGGTPLYDAVVDSVESLHKTVKKNQAVVVVIMTDGEENSSYRHTEKCLQRIIKKLEKKGNWTFAYLGANQDAWATASNLGFSKGNVMAWSATSAGANVAFTSLVQDTVSYSDSVAAGQMKGTRDFFNKEDGEVK